MSWFKTRLFCFKLKTQICLNQTILSKPYFFQIKAFKIYFNI